MHIRQRVNNVQNYSCFCLWVIFGLLTGCATSPHQTASTESPNKPALTLAVWDFDNNAMAAGDLGYLSQALSEALLIDLAQTPGIRLLERSNLRKVLEEQHLGSSQLSSEESKLKLGRLAGANHMAFGSFVALGNQIRVDVRVVDVETSLVKFSEDAACPIKDALQQMPVIAKHLAAKLAASEISGQGGSSDMSLWKKYAEGVALMDKHDYDRAITVFQLVLKSDPHFAAAEKQIRLALELQVRQ